MPIVVGVDVDGVLRDLIGGLTRTYSEHYPDHEIKPVTAWGLEQFFPIGEKIYDFLWRDWDSAYECYRNSKAYPGAIEFAQKLFYMDDVEVAIVTSQPTSIAKKMTWRWLYKNGFIGWSSSVIMLSGELKKSEIRLDVLIDDCGVNLKRCYHNDITIPICFDQPWNQDWAGVRAHDYDEAIWLVSSVVEYGIEGWLGYRRSIFSRGN